MANNYDSYDNNFVCDKCGELFQRNSYLTHDKNITFQNAICPSCKNKVVREAVRKISAPVFNAPLPKPEPTTKKIGRSTWSSLPPDLAFVYEVREVIKELDGATTGETQDILEYLEESLESNFMKKYPEDVTRVKEVLQKYSKEN